MNERSLKPSPPGLLLVLSAPSGAGKTTLARRLVDEFEDAVFSVSCTTRPPRAGERHGVDYYFLDEAAFDRMVAEDAFAEWANVHGRRYGTPKAAVESHLEAGHVVVFDIDVQGGEQIVAGYPDAATVLVAPPSLEVLERRLRTRSTDTEAAIAARLSAARAELRRSLKAYRYLVVNDQIDRAYESLRSIVQAERSRLDRLPVDALAASLEGDPAERPARSPSSPRRD